MIWINHEKKNVFVNNLNVRELGGVPTVRPFGCYIAQNIFTLTYLMK